MSAGSNVTALFIADGPDFVSRAVTRLDIAFEGIPGDRHFGFTRSAGGREPWYRVGTPIRNDRQVTIVSCAELAEIARLMEIAEIKPEWIGANVLVDGIEGLTALASGTTLTFASGAVLKCMGANKPCRHAGAAVARRVGGAAGLDLAFAKLARGLRGIIASVELPGEIATGDAIKLRRP